MKTQPSTIGEIVAAVKNNIANGTAVIGPTHYDANGQPIDLSGRRPEIQPERDPVFDVCDDPHNVGTLADNDDASEYEAGFGDE